MTTEIRDRCNSCIYRRVCYFTVSHVSIVKRPRKCLAWERDPDVASLVSWGVQ